MNQTDPLEEETMPPTHRPATFARELAYRSSDGLEVWLLWSKETERLFVLVVDSRMADSFEITVESHYALDAFEHPYAYAAWRGVEYVAPRRQTEPAYA